MHKTAEKVLLSLYNESKEQYPEYQKNVTYKHFDIKPELFELILKDLQEDGFIKGLQPIINKENRHRDILFYSSVKVTKKGEQYIEDLKK